MLNRLLLPFLITATLGASPMHAQDLYRELAANLAKEGLAKADIVLDAVPSTLSKGLAIAKEGYEFDTNKYCLGNLQSIINLGAAVSNSMPFSQVWTFEDGRGPVGLLRIMLDGHKIHTEVFCDGKTLKAVELPWGGGSDTLQEFQSTSISSLLGIGLSLKMQGFFDNDKEKLSATNTDSAKETGFTLGACSEAEAPNIGGPFELVSKTGTIVTDIDIITKPTLIYFGYTSCPDVCPLDLARNAEAIDHLAQRNLDVGAVFISVDPNRDTPEVVGDFAFNTHEKMIGLTGSSEQVRAASIAYRTFYKAQRTDDEYYLVDHSTFTYLMFPETGIGTFFRRETSPERVAEITACLMK